MENSQQQLPSDDPNSLLFNLPLKHACFVKFFFLSGFEKRSTSNIKSLILASSPVEARSPVCL